jgi:hypothetical protein
MTAYELRIAAKVKSSPFDTVAPDDFVVHPGRAIDAQVVLDQPNISLYCLDHATQCAWFVQTPPEVNLFAAPFFFIAQYEAAERLVAVPYATLHALVRTVELDPQRIVLVYSTGRCGSTLLSHVLNQIPTTASYAEPDVFTQLVTFRTTGVSDDRETMALLSDALLVMCAHAQRRGYQYWAFKFKSYVLSVSDLLYNAVPEAKLVFLYRNALSWAQSFSRAFGSSDAALEERLHDADYRPVIPSVATYVRTHRRSMPWVEYLTHMWVSTMQDSRRLQHNGATLACARFEDLQVAPRRVIQALLTQCALPVPDHDRFARVLAEDAQAGTAGAQEQAAPVRRLSDADLTELTHAIHRLDPTLAPDTTLPQTVHPA